MLLLNNSDVSKVLDAAMCLDALEGVFHELAAGEAVGLGRMDLYVPSGEEQAPYYRWAVMAGGSRKDGYVCARMLSDMVAWPREYGSIRENKYARQPGTFCGLLFLFSARSGEPVAMINDGVLQHVRVAGGAGLGVKHLSRPDSSTVGMIGSGGMARTYLDSFLQSRPITKVQVFSPNSAHRDAYAAAMADEHGIEVVPVDSAREAVRGADIVSICTSSNEPVFLDEWLEPGMHVTNLTSADVERTLYRTVDVAIRPGQATPRLEHYPEETFHARAGYLASVAGTPEERAMVPRVDLPADFLDMPRLSDLLAGRIEGRTRPEQTSFFNNVGAIGAQFEAVASAVYEKARDAGIGTQIPTEWFLQDVRD